jgi:hypothetical protein
VRRAELATWAARGGWVCGDAGHERREEEEEDGAIWSKISKKLGDTPRVAARIF